MHLVLLDLSPLWLCWSMCWHRYWYLPNSIFLVQGCSRPNFSPNSRQKSLFFILLLRLSWAALLNPCMHQLLISGDRFLLISHILQTFQHLLLSLVFNKTSALTCIFVFGCFDDGECSISLDCSVSYSTVSICIITSSDILYLIHNYWKWQPPLGSLKCCPC